MTEPDPAVELEIERRLEDVASRERETDEALERRIDSDETRLTAIESVSQARRWALPIVMAVAGTGMTIFNIIYALTRRH